MTLVRTNGDKSNRGLALRISIRLTIALLLLLLLEVSVVLISYGSNYPKLAAQLITVHAERIGRVVAAAATPEELRAQLSQLESPTGSTTWAFTVHDRDRQLLFELHSPTLSADLDAPDAASFDWTHLESVGGDQIVHGGRRLAGVDDIRITLGIAGDSLALFAPAFVREAIDHVALPVIPLVLVLLIVNVQIVRSMLAPLSRAAAQVDALDASRMDARLDVPTAAHEVQVLVLAVNRALDRLQHAMTVLESFTADAAHELRTPLSVLRLRIDSLPPGVVKERLLEELGSVTRLADQLLDLAQADVLDIRPGSIVSLSELARDVAARMHPKAFASGCDIRLIDRGGGTVAGHAEALARVLTNLIDNAVGHSTGTAVEVTVGPGPRISVRDHGLGIPAANMPFLFKRFWRGSTEARDGAGLGLAIAHSIITRHKATITAANADGGGAVFTIEWLGEIPT